MRNSSSQLLLRVLASSEVDVVSCLTPRSLTETVHELRNCIVTTLSRSQRLFVRSLGRASARPLTLRAPAAACPELGDAGSAPAGRFVLAWLYRATCFGPATPQLQGCETLPFLGLRTHSHLRSHRCCLPLTSLRRTDVSYHLLQLLRAVPVPPMSTWACSFEFFLVSDSFFHLVGEEPGLCGERGLALGAPGRTSRE